MMTRCLIILIFALLFYAVFVTWRWRLAVARAKKNEGKASKLDKIAKELDKPQ